jgi:hypothetical protein
MAGSRMILPLMSWRAFPSPSGSRIPRYRAELGLHSLVRRKAGGSQGPPFSRAQGDAPAERKHPVDSRTMSSGSTVTCL